jgi:polynucleotide 5'-kinase involved in rRNA processing
LSIADNIIWRRGNEKIDFNIANKFFVLGLIGTAKSTFLEMLAEEYLFRNQCVLDLFGST